MLDLVASRVDMMVASIALLVEHIQTGASRPLEVLGRSRAPALPNVPTMTEAGYSQINVVPWYGYIASKGDTAGSSRQNSCRIYRGIEGPQRARRT